MGAITNVAKKIEAPKTYDPGKGRPREHLAYLNEREMAYLRALNKGSVSRGPKGLPSFAEERPAGPGGPNGPNSGPSGSLGGGGGGGSGSPAGAGGATSAGARGAGSNYGPGSAQPSAASSMQTQAQAAPTTVQTPRSPMSTQGPSFSSPVFALGVNRDYIDRQRAAMADASSALRSNKAAKSDLLSGGIRSINVGPVGTPVNVYSPLSPVRSSASIQRMAGPSIRDDRASSTQLTQSDLARIGAAQTIQEQELRDFLRYGPKPTPTGNPIMAGGVPTVNPNKALIGAGYGTFNVPQVTRSIAPAPQITGNALPSFDIPQPVDVTRVYGYGPKLPGERILNVEDVPPENQTIINMTTPPPPVKAPPNPYVKHGLVGEKMLRPGMYKDPLTPEKIVDAIRNYVPGTIGHGNLPESTDIVTAEFDDGIPRDPEGNAIGPETPTAADEYVEESPFRITGGRFYDAAKKKLSDYLPSFPSLTGGPGSDYSRFTSDNDRGPIRRNPFQVAQSTSGVGFGGGRGGGGSSSRPQQYYNWDAGVGIPSPGDSDYTLYLKYLQEKAAAQAAVS